MCIEPRPVSSCPPTHSLAPFPISLRYAHTCLRRTHLHERIRAYTPMLRVYNTSYILHTYIYIRVYAGPASTRVALRSRGVFTIFALARHRGGHPLIHGNAARRAVEGVARGEGIGGPGGRDRPRGGEASAKERREQRAAKEWGKRGEGVGRERRGKSVGARRGARIPGGESPGDGLPAAFPCPCGESAADATDLLSLLFFTLPCIYLSSFLFLLIRKM